MTDLNCKETERLIPQFLKDELDHRTEKRFLRHVGSCPSCLEELSIQFLVTTGMQRLENGDTFDLNRELRAKIDTEKRHLHVLDSLQHGLYATEAVALFASVLILMMVVL
ncbi:MAG: zf-HC2 domain-containing protein [Eubacteriales bacterium]|nr:zf-HC2 domain-containing protein [Eubacteriales bacterium]